MKKSHLLLSLALSLLIAVQAPLAVLAEEAAATPTDQTTVAPDDQGATPTVDTSQTPDTGQTGDSATTPVTPTPPAQADPQTGPNNPTGKAPDYAFNDATRRWEPTIVTSFSWDPASGLWLSPFYTYEPVVGWYHVKPQITPSSSINALTAGSGDPAKALAGILGLSDPSNSNTGPGSNNNSTLNNSNNLLANLLNNASVNNFESSTAASGDASVGGNTNGGASSTGAAAVVSNLLNLLNAMWTWGNGGFGYFVQNIFGHQVGDVNLNAGGAAGAAGSLGACVGGLDSNSNTGAGSTNNATTNCNNNINVNSRSNGSINNNVDLLAQSGNANVGGNTNGGSAMSGDARAELNIVNLINSAIGSGQSFFGMLNIYGDLDGDILFPGLNLSGATGSSPSGAAVNNSNTGPGSTNNATANNNDNATVNNTNNGTFNNNINATATSGAANVSGNTAAGSATTGTADTNSSLFNLFDTSVFGDNAILVIVNDMGHWVGRILNLGGGTSLGGLLTSGDAVVSNDGTGPGSVNNATSNNNNNATVNNTNNGTITNNVRARAISGDANVSGNTIGGDATSGNASVASNIVNFFGSHLNLKKVFGILIINVFGSWHGSVGVDTDAGNAPSSAPSPVVTLAAVLPSVTTFAPASGTGSGAAGTAAGAANNSASASNLLAIKTVAAQKSFDEASTKAKSSWPTLLVIFSVGTMLLAGGLSTLEKRLASKNAR